MTETTRNPSLMDLIGEGTKRRLDQRSIEYSAELIDQVRHLTSRDDIVDAMSNGSYSAVVMLDDISLTINAKVVVEASKDSTKRDLLFADAHRLLRLEQVIKQIKLEASTTLGPL